MPATTVELAATAGTFADKHQLAVDLPTAVTTIEQVPNIPMFRTNTAAFIHDLRPTLSPMWTETTGTSGSKSSRTPAPSSATNNSPSSSS